ncbi:MAG TPA: hypothetical protein VKF59_06760 [Candidatus Dormibacteraeota bacterium]|nr:hypothetical protein [Candidatus Dormibacteraeota bacterium]
MSLSFAQVLIVASLLLGCGALAAARRLLAALPSLAAGAALCMAGVARFAAGRQDPDTGRELAVLVLVLGLATAILGAAWARGGAH